MSHRISPDTEHYVTIRQATKLSGLKYHALLRAVNSGLIPSYRPFNSRRLVILAEVETYIRACRTGGGHGE